MAEPINLDLLALHLQAIRAELRDMQFHADNDRRNFRSQFDNLAATLGSQLGDVEAKMAARLVGERFAHLDERIGILEERFGDLDQRMTERMDHLVTLVEQVLKNRPL
jgi:hypothetical protein